ncbi:unnamed protein product [Trichogramma brassicae]|uniref:Uncharacterized protein n=1 Tax=Trichogramma brassicae TaxID=86971 RepID=A0A6H5IBI5_9HYME|nr:unnamed protein product [Trichogramma brassicae]
MQKLLRKVNKINDQTSVVFHTMIMHMGLQLFSDPELAVTSIDDLQSCYDHVRNSRKQANDDEPEWVEVVIDLILSLLSHKSHLLRSLVSCVFPHICPHLNAQAMSQILKVLDVKKKNPLKSNPESDSESESMDEDEDDEDDDDDDENDDNNDDKKTNGVATNGDASNESEEDDEEDEEDSDSDDDDDDEDDEDDETLTDRVRLAVQSALGSAANPETDGEEDLDVDCIDEAEGERLNDQLAAAFRILKENRKSRSKKQQKDAQALTHFRTRVLDLLEMYFESEPSMSLALATLVPLFALLQFSIQDAHQRPLEMRVRGCLKRLSACKKFRECDVTGEMLTTILKVN